MALSSIEFLDQGVSIPYHKGLSLGHEADFTNNLVDTEHKRVVNSNSTKSQVDSLTCQYSLATSLNDVCKVLDIPAQYALKVEAGLFLNDVVSACLQDIYSKQAIKLIIRTRFIKEMHHFLGDVPSSDGLGKEESTGFGSSSNHVINAVCLGEELVVIIRITAPTKEKITTFRDKVKAILGNESGVLNQDAITSTLTKLADQLESKMAKSHYADVICDIQYGVCLADDENASSQLPDYPSRLNGMPDVVKYFIKKWCGEETALPTNYDIVEWEMKVIKGKDIGNGDVVTPSNHLFKLRVTLEPQNVEEHHTPDDPQIYESIYSCLYAITKTMMSLKSFLQEHSLFSNPNYKREAAEIQSTVANQHQSLCDLINYSLQLTKPLTSEETEYARMLAANLPELVESFIEKVTTRLPNGGDVNLLIIGKTGHGKSSTANSILRRPEFKASSGGISETKSCQTAWTETDGRVFKVVDVPGVCDTDLDSVDSAKLAMRCISEAISSCSTGFHALLIVIRYGNRMTEEEERAIYILKCILGSAIVNTHCICAVTHGDVFEADDGNFHDWCRKQEGFLKTVFEECNYRCVLFNNKAKDSHVIKTQLIQLVTMVDSLENRGTCYTNEIFKHAEKDRERLLRELQLPQFKEDIFRDLDLIQCAFGDANNAEESQKNTELEKLKSRCDNLVSKLDGLQCSGVSDLYLAVSNMSQQITLQKEKNLAAVELRVQQQEFKLQQEKKREEALALERRLAEETERRIKEEQERKRIEEEMKKNYVRKKSRWVTFRDSIFK